MGELIPKLTLNNQKFLSMPLDFLKEWVYNLFFKNMPIPSKKEVTLLCQ